MSVTGIVESIWRYPVKSMAGEELDSAFAGCAGIGGDRLFAFSSSASRPAFPYFTARDQREMLLYRPRFRQGGGRDVTDLMVDVETPTGECLAIDDPALVAQLRQGLGAKHHLTLLRSARALTDSQPVSVISSQTVKKLGEETGATWDQRRFRANLYLDLSSSGGFAEDELVGHSVRIGASVVISVLQRDLRCMVVTLDPETAAKSPALLKNIAQAHGGAAGVYGAVLTEGILRKGDAVELIN